ncbi:sigma-70 family RNA polymerase sigma factor [uncultured Sphingomonas sp.]|uniref:sigma-70 family RNA polymerase sigma factor n=1 Tax=uncultured Sphingomonas sp. TaxID=158754 RepID=UPI0035CA9C39
MKSATTTTERDSDRSALVAAIVATGVEDRAAFGRLYRLTSAKLFGICLRICGTREAAEDVLQEVYLIIWKRAGAFEPGRASPITWLATIARNRAIDWRRQHPHRVSGGSEEADAVPDPSPDAVTGLLVEEHERRLFFCLEGLDGTQRETIRTAFFGGLTYAELAGRRGVPVGTVKSWVRRGLARLRACLTDDA